MKKLLLLLAWTFFSLVHTSYSWSLQCISFTSSTSRSDAELKSEILRRFEIGQTQSEIAQDLGISLPRVAYLEARAIIESGGTKVRVVTLIRPPKDIRKTIYGYKLEVKRETPGALERQLRIDMIISALRPYGDVEVLFNFLQAPDKIVRPHTPGKSGLAWASHYIKKQKVKTGFNKFRNAVSGGTFKFWEWGNVLPISAFNARKDRLLRIQRAAEFEIIGAIERLDDMPPPVALRDKLTAMTRALEVEAKAIADLGPSYERLIESGFSVPRPDAETNTSSLPEIVADYVTQRARWITLQQDALFDSGAIPRED